MIDPAEVAERLRADGFTGGEPGGLPRVSISTRTWLVEHVELEPGATPERVAEALLAARVIAATPSRPRPSLLDAVVLRLSGRSLGAELAADVQAVLDRGADGVLERLEGE